MVNVYEEFQKLSEEISREFKRKKITHKDVDEAIKWARKNSS